MLFGTDADTDGIESSNLHEDLTPEAEKQLEDKLTKATASALVQINEGQLATRRRNPINDFANFLLVAGIFVGLMVIFSHLIFWIIIAAVVIALGVVSAANFAVYHGCNRPHPVRGCDDYRGPY